MIRLMLDLETLSTKPNAAVLEASFVEWDLNRIYNSITVRINPMETRGDIDEDTIEWWKKQDPTVRTRVHSGMDTTAEAVAKLSDWLDNRSDLEVWANSPAFDVIILRNCFYSVGRELSLRYFNERDCRTMFDVGRKLKLPFEDYSKDFESRAEHDSYSDCVEQIRACQYIMREISYPY